MTKKRLLTAVASTAMATVTALAFVACGNTNDPAGSGSGTGTGGNGGNGGTTATDVMTNEQWQAAYGVENFLKDAKIEFTQTLNDNSMGQAVTLLLGGEECGSFAYTETSMQNGQKTYESTRIIIDREDHRDRYYKVSDEDWEYFYGDAYDYAANDYERWIDDVLTTVQYEYLEKVADAYTSFNYNSDRFVYSGTGLTLQYLNDSDDDAEYMVSLTANAITVTFADDKLANITMTCHYVESMVIPEEDVDDKMEMDMIIEYTFTFAPQTVEAPEGVDTQE